MAEQADLKKTAPYPQNPEGLQHVDPKLLENLEPDEQAFIKDSPAAQKTIQKAWEGVKPTIDETKSAILAGGALGGWWRRYIDAFNALGEHTNEDVASKLGGQHADALKVWHAAVSGSKSVEKANRIAWGSYADWLDKGMPRDRKAINKIVEDNHGISDLWKATKEGKKERAHGLDTTKLFRLINSPEMRQIDPSPWHGNIFDPEHPSPIYGTSSGAHKIPSMGATVAGAGNLMRLVLDTHMLDYFGEKGWTDNKYIAFSAHLRQAAKELGLLPGEGQEQIWGTVLGIKKLLKKGVPDKDIPTELTNNVVDSIGKDYAEIIQDQLKKTPELQDAFNRLKKHGIDPGGNAAQSKLADILSGKRPTQEGGFDKSYLAQSAARIRAQLKNLPEPNAEENLFNFGARKIKGAQEMLPEEAEGGREAGETGPQIFGKPKPSKKQAGVSAFDLLGSLKKPVEQADLPRVRGPLTDQIATKAIGSAIPPQAAWDQFGPKSAPGLVQRGNIPLPGRPVIQNDDGTHSSEYSFSEGDDDGKEVLVPTIVNGRFLTPNGKKPAEGSPAEAAMKRAAWAHYKRTGQHLGKFSDWHAADAFAEAVHNRK
jgi:hypothetical protein